MVLNPILWGVFILFSAAPMEGFDFNMPSAPRTKAKKPRSKAERKTRKIKRAARRSAIRAASNQTESGPRKSIQEQIRILNAKIDRLEAGEYEGRGTKAGTHHQMTPAGYIHIPKTNTDIKLAGYVKVDAIYDANQFTGDSSNLPTLRLKGLDSEAQRSGVFAAHAKQSRIVFESLTHTEKGKLTTFIEGDFFGTSFSSSGTGDFTRQDNSGVNSYNFRLRRAYGTFCGFLVGQDWSTFYDPDTQGTTVEFNGSEATAQIRRPMIRYTRVHNRWKFSSALESGATDYLDITPAFAGTAGPPAVLAVGSPSISYRPSQYRRAQSTFLGGVTGDGNQALPDLVSQIRYTFGKRGHVSLGLMTRQLKIKKVATTGTSDPVFTGVKYGYGTSLGGRWYVHGKSSIFGQFNFGRGIGSYIFAMDGYGAAIDASRGIMKTQVSYGAVIGVEAYWAEKWRTNVILSQARTSIASFIPRGQAPVNVIGGTAGTTGYSISNLFRQFYINLLWAPAEKVDIGIEYAHFRRDTINQYIGYGNRFQFGATYKF